MGGADLKFDSVATCGRYPAHSFLGLSFGSRPATTFTLKTLLNPAGKRGPKIALCAQLLFDGCLVGLRLLLLLLLLFVVFAVLSARCVSSVPVFGRWPLHSWAALSADCVCCFCLSVRCVGCACPGPGLGNSFEYGFRVFLRKKDEPKTAQC